MNTSMKIVLGVVGVVLLSAGVYLYKNPGHLLPVAEGDTITTWDFQGSYKDGGALEKKANDEIARSRSMLGGDQSGKDDNPTDYVLYVNIANQYVLLGNGKGAYENLGRALRIDAVHTGLAWHNLGVLFERLGAYNTARIAYAKAVEVQAKIEQYHLAWLTFLMNHFASDTSVIEAAFKEAKAKIGDSPAIFQIEAEWHRKNGRTSDAADTLENMQKLIGVSNPEVSSEIARLRAL